MDVDLRNELKNWEKSFLSQHNRKPGKDDIKKYPDIALKYKSYGKLKKSGGNQEVTAPPSLPPPASTPKKNTAGIFKTPTKANPKSTTPKKVEYAQASPQKFKQLLNTLSPNNAAKGWTPRTKARKRLRGENVPNTPKKQRMEMLSIDEEEDEEVAKDKDIKEEDEDDNEMMNTPAKNKNNKAFKPLFESPRPSTSSAGKSNSKFVVLPPLPANNISTYIDNPQSQDLISSQSTVAQSQPSQSQRGQKRGQSPDNHSKATISKKKSRTTLKYPNKIELPQSQKLADRHDIHNEPTQVELESTGQQISIIPHMHNRRSKKSKTEDDDSDDTDLEDYIPITQRLPPQQPSQNDIEDTHSETVKSKLGDMSLDSPGAIKRSKEYNKQIDDKVRSLLSQGNEEGFGNYRTEIKPLDEDESEGEDDDWEEDCDGWKADGVGFIEDYDYDEI